jgi:hypothetical protein
MTTAETVRCTLQRAAYIAWGGRVGGKHDPAKEHGVKRLNALYDLEYWKVFPVFPYMRFHQCVVLK